MVMVSTGHYMERISQGPTLAPCLPAGRRVPCLLLNVTQEQAQLCIVTLHLLKAVHEHLLRRFARSSVYNWVLLWQLHGCEQSRLQGAAKGPSKAKAAHPVARSVYEVLKVAQFLSRKAVRDVWCRVLAPDQLRHQAGPHWAQPRLQAGERCTGTAKAAGWSSSALIGPHLQDRQGQSCA